MENIYAFIDSQNLNLAIREMGWILDFRRFRIYLRDKYKVKEAFIFIGYVMGNEKLYTKLQKCGYIVVFKPTLEKNGIIKGNCDAELVLHCMIEKENFDKAIIVSGDGDFHCLVEYLMDKNKLYKLMIPDKRRYSSLLRKFRQKMVFMNNLKEKLEFIKIKKKRE